MTPPEIPNSDVDNIGLRKLTHEEARAEQRVYWSRKTPVERLTAMTELNRRMAAMRGIDLDHQQPTDRSLRRVTRRRS